MPTKTNRTRHVFDRVPDKPDTRDLYAVPGPPALTATLPASVDMSNGFAVRYDQKALGACTGNALALYRRWMDAHDGKPGNAQIDYSRLFIYLEERRIEGNIGSDAGASARDGAKTLQGLGVPLETLWPYDVGKFTVTPPPAVYAAALPHRITSYARIPGTAQAMVKSLAAGVPVALGVTVYNGIESASAARTGVVPLPKAGEKSIGGHEVFVVGYDNKTRRIKFINSWGAGWGDGGCGYFPMSYFDIPEVTQTMDCWTLTL